VTLIFDPATIAGLVRATARLSALLLVTNLFVAARRLSHVSPTGLEAVSAKSWRPARELDIASFVAFLVSHTIHFACVALLALATGGESMRDSGGWTAAMIVAALFYLGGWGVFRAKQRPTHGWVGTRQRLREMSVLAIVWTVFFLGFLGRSTRSLPFASLTIALLLSLALFGVTGVRSPIARSGPGKVQSV
jgi:hypothetical protein